MPELFAAAQRRFACFPPTVIFQKGQDRVEIWDADDFDPWNTLRWETVRIFRYRQYKADGTVVEAYWLTDFPKTKASTKPKAVMASSISVITMPTVC